MFVQIGALNALFVLGRSIGFIGHHLDQKRLKAPLYRQYVLFIMHICWHEAHSAIYSPADDIHLEMETASR